MARIVVGVDGSEGSVEALRWAGEEAPLRSDSICALYAWTYPVFLGAPMETIGPMPSREELVEEGERILEEAIAAAFPGGADVEIAREVVEDPPARALVRASRDADLLVVGSRGHGGFRELLLGSVSHQCVLHSSCPVVIIPHSRDDQGRGTD